MQRFTTEETFNVFVIATDPKNNRHHGLHTNTAPHVLTTNPGTSDKIVAKLDGALWLTRELLEDNDSDFHCHKILKGRFTLDLTSSDGFDVNLVSFGSHPGRAPMLGEDGLEDAFGRDILPELICEKLDEKTWRVETCGWNYAPVCATFDGDWAGKEETTVTQLVFVLAEGADRWTLSEGR